MLIHFPFRVKKYSYSAKIRVGVIGLLIEAVKANSIAMPEYQTYLNKTRSASQ
jgi:hypothetical protein